MKHSGKTPGRGGKKPTSRSFGKSSDRSGGPDKSRQGRPRHDKRPRYEDRPQADRGYRPQDDKKARHSRPAAEGRRGVSSSRPRFEKPAPRKPQERSVSYRTKDGITTSVTRKEGPTIRRNAKPAPRVNEPRPNLFGQHAVREAWLNPKRSIHALYLSEDAAKIFESWPSPKAERPMPIAVQKEDLDRMLRRKDDGTAVHQGFALSAAPLEEAFVQDLISFGAARARSIILMLDQVTDPHNVGAILRSACAFGASGVVMQKRHAPELEGIVAKTASGAADHLPVAYETNLSRALEELKEAGYVVIGLDEHAPKTLSELVVPNRAVLVLGNEGEGMRRLVREHCDHLVTLPTQKPINSLNVSNAAAVALYALVR